MTFIDIARAPARVLLGRVLPQELRQCGYRALTKGRGSTFLYAPGEIPVMLVAHVDTVHGGPPSRIFYDPEARVYWSPDGLGADDRAGVFAILQILRRGFRPYVLFTDLEESGGRGAREAARALDPPVRIVVELDRQGADDACFYNCGNPALEDYVLRFGFQKARGTFTDISILCPEWGVGGVNLSVGFHEAHTRTEYLCMDELGATVERVCRMLAEPPAERFEYIPAADWRWADGWEVTCECALCLDRDAALFRVPGVSPADGLLCATCYKEVVGEWPSASELVYEP